MSAAFATREAPSAAHLLGLVREHLFPLPAWALIPDVASEVSQELPELRRADAIAVLTLPRARWRFVVFEVKRSRGDLARELAHPEKAAVHDQLCGERYIVVPAPWKRFLPARCALEALPDGVGLIEVDKGSAVVVVRAAAREVEEPPRGFLQALYRAAASAGERLERDDGIAGGDPAGADRPTPRTWARRVRPRA